MVSIIQLPLLNELQLVPDDNAVGKYRISFNSFISLLKRHEESRTDIRKDNIRKSFNKQTNGILVIDNEEFISYATLLKFIFQCDRLRTCKTIVEHVQNSLVESNSQIAPSNDTSDLTILDIYRLVANHNFKQKSLVSLLCEKETITSDDEIPSLYTVHKTLFENPCDWEKIRVFEWHFGRRKSNAESLDLHEETTQRLTFFRKCEELANIQPMFQYICKDTVRRNSVRKDAANYKHGMQLIGQTVHIPAQIDGTLLDILTSVFPGDISGVTSTDCQQNACDHHSGLHIYVEVKNNVDQNKLNDMSVIIKSHLMKTHNEHCSKIVYLKDGTFKCYGLPIQRYQLHDDFTVGKIEECKLSSISFESDEDNSQEALCDHCNGIMHHEHPLDWRHFDIVYEWTYHVPLPLQILLESFINPSSYRKAQHSTEYLKSKLQRLYFTFDSLLNIFNRCHSGIFQELNSDELSLSYHSVSSVFSVTSQGGLTCSYAEAERRLQRQADPSVLYFKAFLEKHDLVYSSTDGSSQKCVSLQDCYLVLCLDNLVRLSFHKDQKRGESKSSQLCTLPITIMGVPKDSSEIEAWHDESICDGTYSCQCKESVILQPGDVDQVLLHPTTEEKKQMDFFQMSITWGLRDLWNAFTTFPELSEKISCAVAENNEEEIPPDISSAAVDDDISVHSIELDSSEECFSEGSISSLSISDDDDLSDGKSSDADSVNLSSSFHFDDVTPLNESIGNLTLDENASNSHMQNFEESKDIIEDTITRLGFKVHKPPKLLVRHPPPAQGRDDDPKVLQEILTDILHKTGNFSDVDLGTKDRILFAPDNKIGKNLLQLMRRNKKMQKYLPEFPLLHLRKSKIVNFCSAYRNAGLDYLLGFMKDQEADMKTLLSVENIEVATRNIRRISLSLHLAFSIKFLEYLPADQSKEVLENFRDPKGNETDQFHQLYQTFLKNGSHHNATFALHNEMMTHCDEILAISVAERIGGPDGYNLLLAAVKASLPFSFLSGASSYASFCCELLHQHYSAGVFHGNMKKNLFSTPYKGSTFNFALDSQREMDHKEALKGFRPRATLTSVLPRMSLVDAFSEIHKRDYLKVDHGDAGQEIPNTEIRRTWKITKTDVEHIVPTALLILREGALNNHPDKMPRNVYDSKKQLIADAALDRNTWQIGEYLVRRYAHLHELCGLSKQLPEADFDFPKDLASKVKKMKDSSLTVRRMTCNAKQETTEKEKREKNRQQRAKHLSNVANALTSDMNACQAVVKPDGSKGNVNKSQGMRKAVLALFSVCIDSEDNRPVTVEKAKMKTLPEIENQLKTSGIVILGARHVAHNMSHSAKAAVIEFAGIKFKAGGVSGSDYIKYVESNIVNNYLKHFPNVAHMIICEEKYGFTPDDFKAETRSKRKKSAKSKSVVHLKRGSEIISLNTFDKQAACLTSEGKALVSTFLAANIDELDIRQSLTLDIDSEWIRETEVDSAGVSHSYAIPTRTQFGNDRIVEQTVKLSGIHQRKGEAEMAQLDWLLDVSTELKDGDSVVSVVTSGDIDAIPIHLFALAQKWPRKEDGTFQFPVFVLLQKARGMFDIFNVTNMIEILEKKLGHLASMKIAIILCMGGNDFLLKFQGISHEKMILAFIESPFLLDSLVIFDFDHSNQIKTGHINKELFQQFISTLYCPSNIIATDLTFSQIRQITIKYPGKLTLRKPHQWMPPSSALHQIALLVDYQIQYLLTAGDHAAYVPNFLEKGCLRKDSDGTVCYYLGPDAYVACPEHLLKIPDAEMKRLLKRARKPIRRKRAADDTPQKGQRRKLKPKTSTPRLVHDYAKKYFVAFF